MNPLAIHQAKKYSGLVLDASNLLALNGELCFNPGTISTVFVGSLTSNNNFACCDAAVLWPVER